MPVLNLVVCDWLFWPACQHWFCIYIWCVLAVLRSGLTTIEIKWLLLLLFMRSQLQRRRQIQDCAVLRRMPTWSDIPLSTCQRFGCRGRRRYHSNFSTPDGSSARRAAGNCCSLYVSTAVQCGCNVPPLSASENRLKTDCAIEIDSVNLCWWHAVE